MMKEWKVQWKDNKYDGTFNFGNGEPSYIKWKGTSSQGKKLPCIFQKMGYTDKKRQEGSRKK